MNNISRFEPNSSFNNINNDLVLNRTVQTVHNNESVQRQEVEALCVHKNDHPQEPLIESDPLFNTPITENNNLKRTDVHYSPKDFLSKLFSGHIFPPNNSNPNERVIVTGSLDIAGYFFGYTSLQNVDPPIKAPECMHLFGSTSLPKNLKVEGDLNLNGMINIKSLPEGLEVNGSLHLVGLELEPLANNVTAGKVIRVDKKDVDEFMNNLVITSESDSLKIKESIIHGGSLTLCSVSIISPAEIGKLTHLTDLYFQDILSKCLPSEIGNLINLKSLGLKYNELERLPTEIGNLINLEMLDLEYNELERLPLEIGKLSKLKTFNARHNNLKSLPPEIGNLTKMIELDLRDNELTGLPISIKNMSNLTCLDLRGNPIAEVGDETTLGRRELTAHFGDIVVLDEVDLSVMPANTTKEQVYQALDKQAIRVNREKLKNTKMPEIPDCSMEGDVFIEVFGKVVSLCNFDDEKAPGYLSHELLAGDYASHAEPGSNWEKVRKNVLLRLSGYFKTLYKLPLEQGETSGWQMYKKTRPALKKALSYILTQLVGLEDAGQRAMLFLQLVQGLLHCPTGQKEGIDTVVLALLDNRTALSSDLELLVQDLIAKKKNAFFKTAILTKGTQNTQNVHLIARYENKLQSELGLSNVLEYQEKIGIMGTDPFNNNIANVLKVFYDILTPQRMVDWLLEKTWSLQDLSLTIELAKLDKPRINTIQDIATLSKVQKELQNKLEDSTVNEQKIQLKTQIQQLQELQDRHHKQTPTRIDDVQLQKISELKLKINSTGRFKPITSQIVLEYLQEKKISSNDNNWWQSYFSSDPYSDETAALTSDGAMKLLIDLGYISAAKQL